MTRIFLDSQFSTSTKWSVSPSVISQSRSVTDDELKERTETAH
jgi:hypothetical protein